MGYHYKGCGLLVLGIAAYALYKTGALNCITKNAVKTGTKVSDWTSEQLTKVKESNCCSKTVATEESE